MIHKSFNLVNLVKTIDKVAVVVVVVPTFRFPPGEDALAKLFGWSGIRDKGIHASAYKLCG
jgi:hypothetical protein